MWSEPVTLREAESTLRQWMRVLQRYFAPEHLADEGGRLPLPRALRSAIAHLGEAARRLELRGWSLWPMAELPLGIKCWTDAGLPSFLESPAEGTGLQRDDVDDDDGLAVRRTWCCVQFRHEATGASDCGVLFGALVLAMGLVARAAGAANSLMGFSVVSMNLSEVTDFVGFVHFAAGLGGAALRGVSAGGPPSPPPATTPLSPPHAAAGTGLRRQASSFHFCSSGGGGADFGTGAADSADDQQQQGQRRAFAVFVDLIESASDPVLTVSTRQSVTLRPAASFFASGFRRRSTVATSGPDAPAAAAAGIRSTDRAWADSAATKPTFAPPPSAGCLIQTSLCPLVLHLLMAPHGIELDSFDPAAPVQSGAWAAAQLVARFGLAALGGGAPSALRAEMHFSSVRGTVNKHLRLRALNLLQAATLGVTTVAGVGGLQPVVGALAWIRDVRALLTAVDAVEPGAVARMMSVGVAGSTAAAATAVVQRCDGPKERRITDAASLSPLVFPLALAVCCVPFARLGVEPLFPALDAEGVALCAVVRVLTEPPEHVAASWLDPDNTLGAPPELGEEGGWGAVGVGSALHWEDADGFREHTTVSAALGDISRRAIARLEAGSLVIAPRGVIGALAPDDIAPTTEAAAISGRERCSGSGRFVPLTHIFFGATSCPLGVSGALLRALCLPRGPLEAVAPFREAALVEEWPLHDVAPPAIINELVANPLTAAFVEARRMRLSLALSLARLLPWDVVGVVALLLLPTTGARIAWWAGVADNGRTPRLRARDSGGGFGWVSTSGVRGDGGRSGGGTVNTWGTSTVFQSSIGA